VNSRPEFADASSGIVAARAMDRGTLSEAAFHRMISLERRRTSRSQKSFLLMLLDMGEHTSTNQGLRRILSMLSSTLRETDVTGWYKEESVVGVMFTEITLNDQNAIPATLMSRVTEILRTHVPAQQFHQIGISFHLLPEVQHSRGDKIPVHRAVSSRYQAAENSL